MMTNLQIRLTTLQLPRTSDEPDTPNSNRPPDIVANPSGAGPLNEWLVWGAGVLLGLLSIAAIIGLIASFFSVLRSRKNRDGLRSALLACAACLGVLVVSVYFNPLLDGFFDTVESGPNA